MPDLSDSAVRLDYHSLTGWLEKEIGATGPFDITLLTGGRSNLTYLIEGADQRYVLRRPPSGDLPKGAHDVLREAGILSSLEGKVPVPKIYGCCEDREILGVPFIVMEHLEGHILRTPEDVQREASMQLRASAGASLVDALVDLHKVPVEKTSLSGLADRKDYLQRQLHRWDSNWKHTRTRDLPDLAAAHEWLVANAPAQPRVSIVHGDFRLDNCMLDSVGAVVGVLDWEIATVGDPMADLGQLLMYWAEPADEFTALVSPPTQAPGFTTRDELARRYLEATNEDPARLEYFIIFNWWKVACIVENVYSRMLQGVMGEVDRSPESFGEQARGLAAMALRQAVKT